MSKHDDCADFIAHPEWFTVKFLTIPPLPDLSPELAANPKIKAAIIRHKELSVNPPVMFQRNAVPFILPIKGAD